MNQQQSPFASMLQNYAIAKWLTQFPALTLIVILRRDVGYRLLNIGVLTVVPLKVSPNFLRCPVRYAPALGTFFRCHQAAMVAAR